MKSATDVHPANDEQSRLRRFDLREIDAPDQRSHFALKYTGRLEAVLAALRRTVPPGGAIVEVGCAQANASLLLAEEGYVAVGVDLVPEALAYARRKRERGRFLPLGADARHLPIKPGSCDAVYLGEVLEHCADPTAVLRQCKRCLTDEGVMVVTTMNGEWFGSPDPTYSQARTRAPRKPPHGAGGEDHLFAFTAAELLQVIQQAGLRPLRLERHASVIHSDRLMWLKRLAGPRALRALSRLACRLPFVGRRTALTLMVIAKPVR